MAWHKGAGHFHKPADEKRMVVILPEDRFEDWLCARPEQSMDFMRQFPSGALQAISVKPSKSSFLDNESAG